MHTHQKAMDRIMGSTSDARGGAQAIEIIPGDAGAAFLLGYDAGEASNYAHCAPKKYLLKTSQFAHVWRGGDGEIHGTLILTPIG